MFSFRSMSNATVKRERAEQMLGELAELSLMLARDLATEARAAEAAEEKVALTTAFQKMARTTRLTLALDFKLDRDAARDVVAAAKAAQEAAADAAPRESRIMRAAGAADRHLTELSPEETQKRRVKGVLNRLLWYESEGDHDEYEVLIEDLDARLYEAAAAPGFAGMPIEVLAQKLAADMQLSGELVVTTAERIVPANTPTPPLADTG